MIDFLPVHTHPCKAKLVVIFRRSKYLPPILERTDAIHNPNRLSQRSEYGEIKANNHSCFGVLANNRYFCRRKKNDEEI